MKVNIPDELLMKVSKPTRYTGNEWNSVTKDHSEADVKIAFAFPDVYEVGMSHLGIKILYHIVNEQKNFVAERVFAPWVDMEDVMRENEIPLFTLETFTPVKEFDILGFTLQYEMSYTNILNMLDLAGVPIYASERDESTPLVIAGGPCAYNPEPLADFIDLFVIGESEELILEFLEAFKQNKDLKRNELLKELSKVPGVYVPSFYQVEYSEKGEVASVTPKDSAMPARITKRVVKDLNSAYYPTKPIVPFMEIVHDRIALEVLRGCTRGCRFCQAGILYRPVRERSLDVLFEQAEKSLKNTGYDEISLVSLSTCDHSKVKALIDGIIERFGDKGVGVSLPSQRIDAFSIELAKTVQQVRKTGLTFAPEAGSQRMRDVINKGVTEQNLFETVEAAFSNGWQAVKLYFMIGLPTENDEDIAEIARLSTEVWKIGRKYKRNPKVNVSVSSFVPKPHTPFQWESQIGIQEIHRRQDLLRSKFKSSQVSLGWHDAKLSYMEGVFSRGDRRVGQALYTAWKSGCRFDGWSEHFRFDLWMRALETCNLDPDFYTQRQRQDEEALPWDHISTGAEKRFLLEEKAKAFEQTTTQDCRHNCTGCEVCPQLGVSIELAGGSANE